MPTINSVIEELKKSGVNSKQTALEMLEELQKQQNNPTEFEKWLEKRIKWINGSTCFGAYEEVLAQYQEFTKGKIVLVLDKTINVQGYQEALEFLVINSCPQAIKDKKYCDKCVNKNCNATAKWYVDKLQNLLNILKQALEVKE
jgi:hypothetical protein